MRIDNTREVGSKTLAVWQSMALKHRLGRSQRRADVIDIPAFK